MIRALISSTSDASNGYTSDESINIRVYETGNRSVANIQTEFELVDRFLRPISGEGSGSGWVYDKLGHIVTNYHVIEKSDRIKVTLFDGETASARLVGGDPPARRSPAQRAGAVRWRTCIAGGRES